MLQVSDLPSKAADGGRLRGWLGTQASPRFTSPPFLPPCSWLVAHVPLCYAQAATVLGPALEGAWRKTREAAASISAQLDWLGHSLLSGTEWVRRFVCVH